jgi:hypothetical protein
MKLFAPTKKFAAPAKVAPVVKEYDVLLDEEHDTGQRMRITVDINDGRVKEVCEVRAGQPGLACNRAWKLVKAKHKTRMRNVHVVFDVEVL